MSKESNDQNVFFETENFKFFSHKECECFPCHDIKEGEKFNCLFCYCPLYTLGEQCGGNFKYIEDDGTKDCSECLIPHMENAYDYIVSRWDEVAELAKKK